MAVVSLIQFELNPGGTEAAVGFAKRVKSITMKHGAESVRLLNP